MQAAKDAIKNITSKHGHHDTSVHETVAPAVTQETITRNQEDRITSAVDKEVHQDHYHTSVQPVHDTQVLPEVHHHKQAPVQERTFDHNDDSQTKQRLAAEAAQFKDSRTLVDGQHTAQQNPTVAGEHVHHHVHETIQPVVNKQTIEPHVVHQTVPIHEVHHNAAQHHEASTLPPVSIDDFKNKGGVLDGRGERRDDFEGEPRTVGGTSTTTSATGLGSSTTSSSTAGSKPSMMDKLNPKKDADGDGKTGIMD